MPTQPNETCTKCGVRFSCGFIADAERCWCADLPRVMAVAQDTCLCPDCLHEAIARQQAAEKLES